jgi:transposase
MALYARALGPGEHQLLESLERRQADPDMAKRARIIVLSARKHRVHEISALVGLHPINVRKWIHRFNHFGIDGLYPRRSPGRPRLFAGGQRQAIISMATSDPQSLGLAFSAWSLQRLRSQLIARGVVSEISAETIRQELLRAGLTFEGRRWARMGHE